MYIKKIKIENFGKFQNKTIEFTPGINVIYGENESGKSTVHAFLTGMLFGMERQRGRSVKGDIYQRYEPWNVSSFYSGSMEFVVADKAFVLWRNFYHKERTARLHNQQDGEELSVEHGDLQMLLGGINRKFYENTYCIPQAAVMTEENFATELQRELINRVYGGDSGVDVGQAKKILENKYKQQEQRLKKYQQEKKEQQERLNWEQEILKADIQQLQQKILEAEEMQKNTEKILPDSFWFRIPVLGWILKCIWRIFHKKPTTQYTEQTLADKKPVENTETAVVSGVTDILYEQLKEKQMRLSNVQEEMKELQYVTSQQRELEKELKSIRLAGQVIDSVAEEAYQDHSDDMQAVISEIFSGITHGKYDRLEIDKAGNVFLYGEEKKLFPWQLSRGTMEQLYFALRLGAGRCMLQEEPVPLLLDETFGAYDDNRLKQTLRWLAHQKEQIILLSCQKRELSLLEELGIIYHRISLSD